MQAESSLAIARRKTPGAGGSIGPVRAASSVPVAEVPAGLVAAKSEISSASLAEPLPEEHSPTGPAEIARGLGNRGGTAQGARAERQAQRPQQRANWSERSQNRNEQWNQRVDNRNDAWNQWQDNSQQRRNDFQQNRDSRWNNLESARNDRQNWRDQNREDWQQHRERHVGLPR